MTSTTAPTRSRQLAAATVGRPLLTLLQTMLAGSPTRPSAPRGEASAGARQR